MSGLLVWTMPLVISKAHCCAVLEAGAHRFLRLHQPAVDDLTGPLSPSWSGESPRRRQPALAGLASPRHHRREAGGH